MEGCACRHPQQEQAEMQWAKSQRAGKRAVAYYRHSAQDRQENSVEIQQDQVRAFARDHDIEIIREFADRGKSGLSTEDRHEFNEMIRDYIEGGTAGIDYVLVLDVSRWGRFQDTDLSAYYTGLCSIHGVRVVFTTIGFPKGDDLLHGLQLSIERYRAASYSRELSVKVFKGCAKIAQQGPRPGSHAPPPPERSARARAGAGAGPAQEHPEPARNAHAGRQSRSRGGGPHLQDLRRRQGGAEGDCRTAEPIPRRVAGRGPVDGRFRALHTQE